MIKSQNITVRLKLNGKDIISTSNLNSIYVRIPGGLDLPYIEVSLKLEEKLDKLLNSKLELLFSDKYSFLSYKFDIFKVFYSNQTYTLQGVAFYKEMSDSSVDYSDSDSTQAIKKFFPNSRLEASPMQDKQVWIKSVSTRYTLETIWKHSYHPNRYLLLALDDKLYVKTTDKLKSPQKVFSPKLKTADYIISGNFIVETRNLTNILFSSSYDINLVEGRVHQIKANLSNLFGKDVINFDLSLKQFLMSSDNVHQNWNKALLRNQKFFSKGFQTTVTINSLAIDLPLLTPVKVLGADYPLDGIWTIIKKEYHITQSVSFTTLTLWRDAC